MKPIISVIISCYNGEKYIEKSIDRVLKSIFLNYELIIIDDASTDNSKKIITKFMDRQNIKTIFLKKNRGPAFCRNYGAKHSLGKFLLFVDMDCEIEKTALKVIVNRFNKNGSSVGAIVMKLFKDRQKVIDNAGCFMSVLGYPYELNYELDIDKNNKEQFVFGAKTAGLGVKKSVFNKVGGFDKDYKIHGEDIDLTWRIWLAGQTVIYLPTAKGLHHQKGSLGESTKHLVFYEGTKNNLSNLLKNMPFRILIWILPLHLLFILLLSFKLLFEGRFKMAAEMYKGIFWNISNIGKTLNKRHKIMKKATFYNVENIMFGPIKFNQLISKGWRWFSHV